MGEPRATRPKKAIFFAWLIEISAVVLGLVNAYMTSLDRTELPAEKKLMVAAPFAMVAIAELSRIPLVQLFFYTRSSLIRLACLAAVIATAGLTIENFAFGIERLISLRVEDVTAARVVKDEAEGAQQRKVTEHSQRTDTLAARREQIASRINERDEEIARLTQDVRQIEENRKFEITQHTERCKAVGRQCASGPFIDQINREANSRLSPLQDELLRQRREQESLRAQFSTVAVQETEAASAREEDMRIAAAAIAKAVDLHNQVVETSQMHRIAAAWIGVKPREVTDEQFGHVRTFFSLFSAAIISLMGTMLALGYYSDGRDVTNRLRLWEERHKLYRGLRAFIARHRKRVLRVEERVVEVPVDREVEKVVEKIVEVPVEHQKVVEVVKEVPVTVEKVVKEVVEKPVLHIREVIKYVPESWRGAVEAKEHGNSSVVVDLKRAKA